MNEIEQALGRALHRAGLTTYAYATAEIVRLMRLLEEEGLRLEKRDPRERYVDFEAQEHAL